MTTESLRSDADAVIAPKQLAEPHPLAPLTSSDITTSSQLVRDLYPQGTKLQFRTITLSEPAKREAVVYLAAEHSGQKAPVIARRSFVGYYISNTDKFHEAIVNLSSGTVESNVRLGPNTHSSSDGGEIIMVEKIALEDEAVKKEIAKLQLPEGTAVVCDPWIYGSDGINDDKRQFQCFFYIRDPKNSNELDSNHYALPLDISPVVDATTMEVIRIDKLPTGADNTIKETRPYKVQPPNEYISEYQELRKDIKPLNVIQPEGVSFKVTETGETGQVIEWQKWSFRVGFNQREGMVLYDIRYDGRSLFYRLSLSEMNIPYADPRHPFHKKAAFDLGDAGAGVMAGNLKLGCDCLGSIQYLDAVLSNDVGEAVKMENVVCLHEQDAGIGWKHVNYRTGRAAVVRNRELVLQSIITVSNYEYILAFIFNQAGEVTYEVRATGILSTQPIDEGVEVPWGTVVHPGVLAVHHQHIFSLRVDPAIDGHSNRLVYDEAHAMPRDPSFNPHGVGYYVKENVVETSCALDTDYEQNRTFKIQNASSRNPINGKPVSYKISAPPFQKMLADPDSFHRRRAEFADHSIYVTSYQDGELYAGGQYTNQSRGGTGVKSWADRKDNVLDTDIVVWVQFGINHIPRIEDFPVMPVEIIKVGLKPVNFFDKNPALDVPPSEQRFNQSTLVAEGHKQPGGPEAKIDAKGEVCCSSKL
ncbi:MAG: COPII coat Sec23p-Sfb3p heterodimer component [Chaenotheca gracillima]|nr:MAG: COPII coat Sec23p-Sfb3p heterodimer component [Chaenotheca gracillima]